MIAVGDVRWGISRIGVENCNACLQYVGQCEPVGNRNRGLIRIVIQFDTAAAEDVKNSEFMLFGVRDAHLAELAANVGKRQRARNVRPGRLEPDMEGGVDRQIGMQASNGVPGRNPYLAVTHKYGSVACGFPR